MIIREFYMERQDGVKLYRSYSDQGVYITQDQTGREFCDAVDIETSAYTYTETDKPIEGEPELTVNDTLNMLSEMGVDTND